MRLTVDRLQISIGERVLFSDLSFAAHTGDVIAIMGPSGTGKSTLFGAIAGWIAPDSGSIEIAPDRGNESVRTGWVVQSAPILPLRSTIDNARLAATVRRGGSLDVTRRAVTTLKALGILALARKPAHTLSGGEKQRLALCRAIVAGDGLLLTDEPTASLDTSARDHVMTALLESGRQERVTLVATHDLFVAERCDRVVNLARWAP